MITKCEIKNFKGTQEKIVHFSNFSVMVGQNNVGKSTILHAIMLAQEIIKRAIQEKNGAMSVSNVSLDPEELGVIPLANIESLFFNNYFSRSNIASIKLFFTEEVWIKVELMRGQNGNVSVKRSHSKIPYSILRKFIDNQSPFALLVPGLAGISSKEGYIGQFARRKLITLGDSNLVLRNVVISLASNQNKSNEFRKLQQILRRIYPDFGRIVAYYNESEHEYLNVNYTKRNRSEEFDIISAGNGFLQMLQILTYIFEYNPSVLLLDEPDSHLHPSNQINMINEIQNLAQELNTQVIVATHSRDIMKNVPAESILWINSKKETFCGVKEGQFVQTYMDLGGLDELEQLRLKPHVAHVLVEDKNSFFWSNIFEKAIGLNWRNHVLLSSFQGKSSKSALFLLSDFHKNFFSSSRIACIIDRDYDNDQKISNFNDEAKRFSIKSFILNAHEIENYLIQPSVLKLVLKKTLSKNVDDQEILRILNTAIDETYNEHISKLTDTIFMEDRKLAPSIAREKAIELYQIKSQEDIESFLLWLRGKPLLKKVREIVQTTYKVTLTNNILCGCFLESKLPDDIKEMIDWVNSSVGISSN